MITNRLIKKGFTLIELALVVLIIAISIGLATPILRGTFSNLTLKDSSFNISKLINYGQEKAIIDRKNYKVRFDFQNSKYWLLELDNSVDPSVYKNVTGRFGKVFKLPQGVSMRGAKSEIIFFPDGHCDEIDIALLNTKGSGYRISMKGFGSLAELTEIADER